MNEGVLGWCLSRRAAWAAASILAVAIWLWSVSPARATFPGSSRINGPIAYETVGTPAVGVRLPELTSKTLIAVGPSDRDPSWNADADRLAFTSTRDGNEEIYVSDADGGNQRRLTADSARDNDASWSPDGTQVAFMSARDGDPNIYVMDSDGSNVRRLTFDTEADQQPAWSPDGSLIAFTSERDGNREIYVMRPDGSDQRRLTTAPATDADASWSPDAQQIAFTEGEPGRFDVFAMDRDGTTTTQLTTSAGDDHFPSWSPDGTQIAFTRERGGTAEISTMPSQGGSVVGGVASGRDANWAPLALAPPTTVPVSAQTANATTLLGDVFVRPANTAGTAAPEPVVPLEGAASIPTGSSVDTTHGVLGLKVGSGSIDAPVVTNAAAAGARFTLALSSDGATLTLLGARPQLRIRTNGSLETAGRATAARRARRHRRRRHRPRCTYHVKTRYARAAGCGTAWTTEVLSDGTLVTVTSGLVRVDDYGRHRTILVAARRIELGGRSGVVGRYFAAR